MGIGIWAMHYVGMEAFRLPIPVMYDWPTVLLSLFAAILASGVALFTVSRPIVTRRSMIVGGTLMGGGIAAMHYIGMEAMRIPAMCMYKPRLVLVSIVLAIVISYVALQQSFLFRGKRTPGGLRKFGSALLMGLAIPTMHYVGMAAVYFIPRSSITDHDSVSVTNVGLACIVLAALATLVLVLISSSVNRAYSERSQRAAENQLHLQAMFDNMEEAIVIVDGGKGALQHNLAAAKLLGVESKGITLQSLGDSFEGISSTGEVLDPNEWPIMQALRGVYCKNSEVTIRRKDTGVTITTEISTGPIATLEDGSRQIIVCLRDITERKLMDEARTRLASIVESSEDAIIGKDDKGIVTSWNSGAEKIFGYTAQEMIGQPILRLLPEDRRQEETDILERIKRGEIVTHIETVRKRKDGRFINVSLTISPIRDARGKIVGASKIARNITERKQLESQLYQSQKMEAIGQLTGGIAHDFNNLLAVISGNLELLERLVQENAAALKRVQTARKAAARGADLTRRLLAFSSNVELKPAPTRLALCIGNAMELARAVGPEIQIVTSLDHSMPLALVDPAGLESALLNLAVNARDAMPKGGTLTITTELITLEEDYPPVKTGELKSGRYARVSVSDTGHGMSKETLGRVFEPFFTTKPRGKGTGLGLAMVYGFAKQSGGIVRIYSEPGYGTTVSLYLPLAEDIPYPVPTAMQSVSPVKLNGTVLVVDDEVDLLEIAKTYLEEMGYITYQAEDAASALAVVEQHGDIDLIVTDIIMPGGMNGVELAQKIRQSLQQVKVIYCSGFPANALAERSMSLVDGPLLHKPYQRAEFDAFVRAAMEGS
jgi:PAS domain S-box-containing protein